MKQCVLIISLFFSLLRFEWQAAADMLFFNQDSVHIGEIPETPNGLKGPRYFIVQFRGPVFESQKEKVTALGGEILSYIPLNAFIVRMPSRIKEKIKQLPFIAGVGFFLQAHRVSPYYKKTSVFNSDQKTQLIVEFFPGENLDPILERLRKQGAQIVETAQDSIRVSGSRESLSFLEHSSAVSWLEEDIEFGPIPIEGGNSLMGPLEDLTGYETGHKLIESQKLHNLGFTGNGEIIGYSDTGLDIGANDATLHADFIDKIHSVYTLKDGSWKDTLGHGTHIAGSLVGKGALSDGQIKASAFDAKLVVQSLSAGGRFRVPMDIGNVIFSPAYNDGARIHSNSWGSSKFRWGTYDPFSKSVDKFIWDHPDMLVIFSAGNTAGDYNRDGVVDERSPSVIPGIAKNCLTVGASENLVSKGGVQVNWQWIGVETERWHIDPVGADFPSDNPDGIAAFSSRGPTRDGRIKPDVVAPGTNILSTKSHAGDSDQWFPYNDDYTWGGGTSTAAPIVASGLVLIREYLMKHQKLPSPSSALLKALVIDGAVDLFPGQFGDIEKKEIPKRRPNVQEGWGRVNVARAVLETETRKILRYDETIGLATSEEKEYPFEVIHPEEPVSITLVYDDFPAGSSSGKHLVNDLDLQALDSQGNTAFPNGLTRKDDTNNVEGIDILRPVAGEIKVRITAFNVPMGKQGGKQPYALVVSGGIIEKKIKR